MIIIPLPYSWRKFPVLVSVLIALNVLVFLVIWMEESLLRPSQPPAQLTNIDSVHRLNRILLSQGVKASQRDLDAILGQQGLDNFPTARELNVYDRVQAGSVILPADMRRDWDDSYAKFKPLREAAEFYQHRSLFWKLGLRQRNATLPTLLTAMFVHGGLIHLLGNMYMLWLVGTILEAGLGWNFLWIYLVGGLVGNISQLLAGPDFNYVSMGASGAIAALMGFALFFAPNLKAKFLVITFYGPSPGKREVNCPLWFFLPPWLLWQLWMAWLIRIGWDASVGYVAHAGGFIFGGLVGYSWRAYAPSFYRLLDEGEEKLV